MADAGTNGEVDDLLRPLAGTERKVTLDGLLHRFQAGLLRPEDPSVPFLRRMKDSFEETAPRLQEASTNSAADLLAWARRGSLFRALLLFAVGLIILLALTGLLCFSVFFLVATLNAIIVAFLLSLAAAGGMLAIFFSFLAAIYIGAMSTAAVVISTITISAIFAVCITAGWVCLFWIAWLAAQRGPDLAKRSLGIITNHTIPTYTIPQQK